MLDANSNDFAAALKICKELQSMNPYWIEEPTHPDDIIAHRVLAEAIAPTKLALGEHVPNRIIFKIIAAKNRRFHSGRCGESRRCQ